MGSAVILLMTVVSLYGFRNVTPVGSASIEYYDEPEDRTYPTVPAKPANATKPVISQFRAEAGNPRKTRPDPDTDATRPFEPSPKRSTSSEHDKPHRLPGKWNILNQRWCGGMKNVFLLVHFFNVFFIIFVTRVNIIFGLLYVTWLINSAL